MTESTLPFLELFDLRKLLPANWQADLESAKEDEARSSTLHGGGPTSLEQEGTKSQIQLLDGHAVERSLPWLFDLYRGPLLEFAKRASGLDVVLDDSKQSAVNVNILPPRGDGYELHVDSNPVTGLLFLSTHSYEEGGILEINDGDDHWLRIAPLAGTYAVFDARATPHRVTPSQTGFRISAPMNYFVKDEPRSRPGGLDHRLYGTGSN